MFLHQVSVEKLNYFNSTLPSYHDEFLLHSCIKDLLCQYLIGRHHRMWERNVIALHCRFPTRLKYIFAHSDLVWLSIKRDQNGVFSIMFFTVSMKMGPRNKRSYISQGDCVIKRKVKSNEICKTSKHSKQAAKKKETLRVAQPHRKVAFQKFFLKQVRKE